MSGHQSPKATAQARPALPPEFKPIRELLDGSVKVNLMVSVVGVVKDYRLPVKTRGTDYKCTFTLYDTSEEYEGDAIDLNLFRQENEMPEVQIGDIVVANKAKVQNYNGCFSLVCTSMADIHVFDIRKMSSCKAKRSALGALKPPKRKSTREPAAVVCQYIYWLSTTVDLCDLPDQETFVTQVHQSLNIKDKFKMLKDVKVSEFADLVVQVVKRPYYVGDHVTLWVSDYTEHDRFYDKVADYVPGEVTAGAQNIEGDPFGYTGKFRKGSASSTGSGHWIGPQGKKSLQITCWAPHMDFILQSVHEGDWVALRNVQIGEGRNHKNLEGFIREDRKYPDRIYVRLLDPQVDLEKMDAHLLEALRRKRDFEAQERKRLKGTKKRKLSDAAPTNDNSKSRRQKKREKKKQAYEQHIAKAEAAICLHDQIKCENPAEEILPLSLILEPVYYSTTINNKTTKVKLPFTNAKYRTQVRVIDYHPPNLKDFAASRILTEYANLTDDEADDSSAYSSSESEASPRRRPTGGREVWEWRFALRLEEVSASLPKGKQPATTWVLVEHREAQCLTGLSKAMNLHDPANESTLTALRERLFKLWGNLEECKSKVEAKKKIHAEKPFNAPPPASSDVEDNGQEEEGAKSKAKSAEARHEADKISNLPFVCCLKQYGVKVRNEYGQDGDDSAETGTQWQRVFGMFGTMIVFNKDDDEEDDSQPQ